MKKVLFIVNHRFDRNPGQRYRFEQYFDFLEANGIQCHLSNIIDEKDDQILYKPGQYLKKIGIAKRSITIRKNDLKTIHNFDLIVLYREALQLGSTYFEKAFCKSKVPVLFDFDDAVWVKDVSAGNKKLAWLKNADKLKTILPLCDHVTVGNQYLANYAKKYNDNVTIFPSTVDTSKYKPLKRPDRPITIGWIGSQTTVKHFEEIEDVLVRIKEKFGNKVDFKIIGDSNYKNEKLNIQGETWVTAKEVEHFNSLDIGVMPLPNDPWALGKCGMKGLLYMSVGIPSLFSPVGMNNDIIEHGTNGYLPQTDEEWFEILCKLIENENLRQIIGRAGLETIEKRYSKIAFQNSYLQLYLSLMK